MSVNQEGFEHSTCMDQFIGILLIAFQRPLYPIKIILRRLKTLGAAEKTEKSSHIHHV